MGGGGGDGDGHRCLRIFSKWNNICKALWSKGAEADCPSLCCSLAFSFLTSVLSFPYFLPLFLSFSLNAELTPSSVLDTLALFIHAETLLLSYLSVYSVLSLFSNSFLSLPYSAIIYTDFSNFLMFLRKAYLFCIYVLFIYVNDFVFLFSFLFFTWHWF